ncbi:MAG: RsmD family RNA methyltransferase [Candidatus Fibromonas sp.]|jgi:16S rRNA (guanine966-N2)-methyltransferase|nr:RsmD family RNA methyltransferase [Candidatus Fibromonas sp.]
MRITAGELRGRVLQPLKDKNVRPTSSKTREALFNILGSVEGFKVLDLYAGTGSIGFEAISRGAESVLMIDTSGKLLQTIKETAEKWKVAERVFCQKNDALRFAAQTLQSPEKYDLIFADPPFTENYPDLRIFLPKLSETGFAVFEMPTRNIPEWASEATKIRNYGESGLAVFKL